MPAKVSIGSWAYIFGPYERSPIALDVVLKRLAELGFDGVELCGFKPHAHPELYPTKASREDLVAHINSYGLEISGYGADFTQYPPASPSKETRDNYERCFDENLQFCVDCGIKTIRVDTVSEPPLPEGVDYQTAWQRIVETWRRCARKAQNFNIQVVWEFEPGFMFNKPSEIYKLVEDVGEPNFKVLFDTCHANMCAAIGARQPEPKETLPEGAVGLARLLSGKIGHIHLIDSDNTLHDEMTSTHAPFNKGILNFNELITAILEAGYRGDWWTIDLCFWACAWEATEHCKRFVDELLKKFVNI